MIKIILFTLLITAFGYSFENAIGSKRLGEKVSAGILIGTLFMTLIMILSYQLTNVFNIGHTVLALTVLTGIFFQVKRRLLISDLKKINCLVLTKPTDSQLLLIFLILFFIFSTFFINYMWPIGDWDSVALYDFRALVIKTGNWDIGIKLGYFFHYPPFTSLLHGASYLLKFENAKVLYSFLYLAFITNFYFLLNRRLSAVKSLIGVFLLTVAPLSSGHVMVAYTNLPYTIFFSLGVIYTWEWISKRDTHDLIHAFIFISGSLWIRQAEPFWIIPIILILFTQFTSNKKAPWAIIVSSLLILVGLYNYWPSYVETLNLPINKGTSLNDGVVPEKVIVTIGAIIRNIFSVSEHLIKYFLIPLITLFVPFVTVLTLDQKLRKTKYFRIQLLTITAFFLFVVGGTYIFSFTYATWNQIGGSLTRMIMFFEPLVIYMIMFSNLWFINEKTKS